LQESAREVVLVRVNFTPDDVARTRFGVAPAPMSETVLSLAELRRAAAAPRRARGGRWLRDAWKAFPATARPLLDLLGPSIPWPGFLTSVAPDLQEGIEEVRATPADKLRADLSRVWGDRPGRPPAWVRGLADGDREAVDLMLRALRDLHEAVVAPQWDSVLASFHADVARRLLVLAAGGHEALFGTLHPLLRWRRDGLDRPGAGAAVDLRGDGIVLMPSAFWTGEPKISLTDGGRPSILFYPAQPNGQLAAKDGPMADAAARDSLAALIGPTRATVLRALREPRGTADLAGTARISLASASEHAKVLRDAYLIETRREGRAVRHSLTPLGRTILGQLPIRARPDSASQN
jgi:DNA-binding transcriptional ArsR family regulator